MRDEKLRREAKTAVPVGYYVLTSFDSIKSDDLVWSWTSKEWLRADSQEWLTPTPEIENCVCVIRQIMPEARRKIYKIN